MKKSENTRICVIGAGAAGLAAAYYLNEAGYRNVTVFETQNRVGGKCYSFGYGGEMYDMGGVEVAFGYDTVNELIKRFNLETHAVPDPWLLDVRNRKLSPFKDIIRNTSIFAAIKASLRYIKMQRKYRDQLGMPGYHDIDGNLCVSFKQWLEANGMGALYGPMMIPVTCYGYGYMDKIPAAYGLKYINLGNFLTMLVLQIWETIIPQKLGILCPWPKRLKGGMQSLMEKIAESLPIYPNINAEIKSIKRGKFITVKYMDREAKRGKQLVEEFDELILAMPQIMSHMKFIELSTEEKALLKQVDYNHYYTTSFIADGFDYDIYLEVIRDGKIVNPRDGFPALIGKPWPDNKINVSYCYSEKHLTPNQIEKNLISNLNELGITKVEIIETKDWVYFPHVSGEALKDGFYEKFEALQGINNTYYTGSLLNFELVENVMAYSRDLVKRFF